MSSKRPYDEVEADAPARDFGTKKRKQFKNQRPTAESAQTDKSLNGAKKRARDIERRFARGDDLPAHVRRNLEDELAQCKRQIEDLQFKKKRNDMISRYHKVRFFERQKAERLRKQLKKRLDKADAAEDKAKIEEELHIADVDYHYTKYFPFLEPYVSLYPAVKAKEEASEDEQPIAKRALHAERPPMWKEIEAAMQAGQGALDAMQERRPQTTDALEPPRPKAAAKDRPAAKAKERAPTADKAKAKASEDSERIEGENRRQRRARMRERKEQTGQKSEDGDGEDGFFDL